MASPTKMQVIKALFERESTMANNDRVIAETNAARNDLEGYCLEMRSKVQDGVLKEYMADSIKDEVPLAL